MIFLIEYNRNLGKIVTFKTFEDANRNEAADIRFEMELNLNRAGIRHEVVLLDAVSEEALRRTHRRYFENIEQLATMP